MLQARVLSAPGPLHWHHYLRYKWEGTEICSSLIASYTKHISIQLRWGNISSQVLSPVLPGWKRPWAHLSSLQNVIRWKGTTVVPRGPTWWYSMRLFPKQNQWAWGQSLSLPDLSRTLDFPMIKLYVEHLNTDQPMCPVASQRQIIVVIHDVRRRKLPIHVFKGAVRLLNPSLKTCAQQPQHLLTWQLFRTWCYLTELENFSEDHLLVWDSPAIRFLFQYD